MPPEHEELVEGKASLVLTAASTNPKTGPDRCSLNIGSLTYNIPPRKGMHQYYSSYKLQIANDHNSVYLVLFCFICDLNEYLFIRIVCNELNIVHSAGCSNFSNFLSLLNIELKIFHSLNTY